MKITFLVICTFLFFVGALSANKYGSDELEEDGTRAVLKHIETEGFTNTITSWFRGLPRYNIHFKRISNVFNPDDNEYFESLGVIAMPFAAAAVICFFAGIIAIIIRCCCLFSKKKRQIYKKNWALYSKIKILVTSFLICCAMALCVIASLSIHFSFNNALTSLSSTVNNKMTDINNIDQILDSIFDINNNATNGYKADIDAFIAHSNGTMGKLEEYQNYGDKYEMIRQIVMLVICGIAVVIPFAGLLAACCSSRPTSFCMAVCVLLYIPIFWLIVTIHFPAGTIVADICPNIESILTNMTKDDSDVNEYVMYYLQCEGLSPLANASYYVDVQLNKTQNELNYLVNHNASSIYTDPVRALLYEMKSLQSKLSDLSNCQVTSEAWDQIKTYVCVDILDGFALIILCMGFTALVYSFLGHFGFELFNRIRAGRNLEYDELDEELIVDEDRDDGENITTERTVLLSSFRTGTTSHSINTPQPPPYSSNLSQPMYTGSYNPNVPERSNPWTD